MTTDAEIAAHLRSGKSGSWVRRNTGAGNSRIGRIAAVVKLETEQPRVVSETPTIRVHVGAAWRQAGNAEASHISLPAPPAFLTWGARP